MRVVILNIVFLFVVEIKNAHSPIPVPGNLDLAEWPRSNSKPQSPSGSSSNPCDATTVQSGAPNAHFTCHAQCMTLKSEIITMYNMFPNYKTTQYLHEKCGLVTEGKCSSATPLPVCWCYTKTDSYSRRRNTLYNCHGGIRIMREFTTAIGGMLAMDTTKTIHSPKIEAVHMQTMAPSRHPTGHRSPRKRRPNTSLMASCCGLGNRAHSPDDSAPILESGHSAGPSVPPPNKQKSIASTSSSSSQSSGSEYLPENRLLFTAVQVSGRLAIALIDTGAALCVIHPKFAVNIKPSQEQIYSVERENLFQVSGESTIQLRIATGVTVPVTGCVADRGLDLILGTDFFVAWAAKIRISDRTMELSTGLSQVILNIHFALHIAPLGMMNLHHEGYTPLHISAILNGVDTRVVLDTGSGISIVDKNLVRQSMRPSSAACSFGGSSNQGFSSTAKVSLVVGSYSLTVPVFIPNFEPNFHLLAGNDFIQKYVELIDYESKSVTFNFHGPSAPTQFTTRAFIIDGE